MSTPGFAHDFLRFCYSSFSYIPSVGRWLRIRWFRLPDDTPMLPGNNYFSSPVWDLTKDQWPGFGETGVNYPKWEECVDPPWAYTLFYQLLLTDESSAVHAQFGPTLSELDLEADGSAMHYVVGLGSEELKLVAESSIEHTTRSTGTPGMKLVFEGHGRHGSF